MFGTMDEVNKIIASDLPEIDKLAQTYACIIGRILDLGRQELDLHRAAGDPEALIKAQIKLSVFEHSRAILLRCYQMVTGRRAWDDKAEL